MRIAAAQLDQTVNRPFDKAILNKDRYLVLFGGAGSGKSVSIAQKLIIRVLKAMDKGKVHRFLCLRKTQPAARKSVFPLMLDVISQWGLSPLVKVNKSDMTLTFTGGSQIFITGLDDPEKIKSIHGITGVWLEEATEFTRDDFQQIDLRLRGQTWDYKQIIMSFNPIDEDHWIRKTLFNDRLQAEIEGGSQYVHDESIIEIEGKDITTSMTIMHSTYKDNRFIDDEYKARLEALARQDSNYHNIYTLGRWGVLSGLIFDRYEILTQWPTVFEQDCYGIDFGYSNHPSAIIHIGFNGDCLYLNERLYKRALTNDQLGSFIKSDHDPYTLHVADCAEPKSIQELRNDGVNCIACDKGPDSIIHGIQRIKQFKVFIHPESVNLIKEFRAYKWAEDKNGALLNKPVDFMNHGIDAVRYGVTKLKGMVKAGFSIVSDSPDIQRKEQMASPDYDMANDELVWESI